MFIISALVILGVFGYVSSLLLDEGVASLLMPIKLDENHCPDAIRVSWAEARPYSLQQKALLNSVSY